MGSDYSLQDCQDACPVTDEFRGFEFFDDQYCACLYDAGSEPSAPAGFNQYQAGYGANGPVTSVGGSQATLCYKYHPA